MKNILMIFFSLITCLVYSQNDLLAPVIIQTKEIPKEITIDYLKTVGDSIKIIKADDYDMEMLLINKNDSVKINYLLFIQYLKKDIILIASKFEDKNKTILFKSSYPFEAMRVNSDRLSFFWFTYIDTYTEKRYIYNCSIEKLKELAPQLIEFN